MPLLISLHLLAAVVWVGGMFYAWMAMRPAVAETIDPPQRARLWHATLKRFFIWVWCSVAVLLVSGYLMVFLVFGGLAGTGWHVHLMQVIGWLMIGLFAHVYFVPFRRLARAVAGEESSPAGDHIAAIRRIVGINLLLGIVLVTVASGGRYLAL